MRRRDGHSEVSIWVGQRRSGDVLIHFKEVGHHPSDQTVITDTDISLLSMRKVDPST